MTNMELMDTTVQTKKQTIIRLDEEFLDKLKLYAQREKKSLNAYMEAVLRKEIEQREELPHLEPCTKLSPEIERISGILKGKITQKDIDEDDRLAYLLSR